jgi:branched-chain amino acid aminotransferase
MAVPLVSAEEYLRRMLAVPRVCEGKTLAFYERRVGAICTDVKLMLLPLDDHLAHRGDGVFETIKFTEGRLLQFDAHLERLRRSASGLSLSPPCPWAEIREVALAVAAAGKEPLGILSVLLGRGPGGFGLSPAESPVASLYMAASRYSPKPESWFEAGLKGFRTSIPAKQSYMAQLKNTNYVPNMLMLREAGERGMDTPFCFDGEGFLAESAVANLCLVDATGTLSVPEFTHSLPGTTLLRALELLEGVLPVSFRRISEEEIFAAREVIQFGTGPDCVAVTSYEGRKIGSGTVGPIAKQARQLLAGDIHVSGTPIPGLA